MLNRSAARRLSRRASFYSLSLSGTTILRSRRDSRNNPRRSVVARIVKRPCRSRRHSSSQGSSTGSSASISGRARGASKCRGSPGISVPLPSPVSPAEPLMRAFRSRMACTDQQVADMMELNLEMLESLGDWDDHDHALLLREIPAMMETAQTLEGRMSQLTRWLQRISTMLEQHMRTSSSGSADAANEAPPGSGKSVGKGKTKQLGRVSCDCTNDREMQQ
mmetsp:Transcript_31983/g.56538  ORF Transcript_31983/g.56538 Transcript_31983/m.56538 type:complete len:221 (+) Transcript_31983:76-738(+)